MNHDSGVEKIHKLVPLCYMVISKTYGIFVFLRLSAGGPELAVSIVLWKFQYR